MNETKRLALKNELHLILREIDALEKSIENRQATPNQNYTAEAYTKKATQICDHLLKVMAQIPDKASVVTDAHKSAIHLYVSLQADAENISKYGEPLKDDKINLMQALARVDGLRSCAQDAFNNFPKRSPIQAVTHFAEKLSPRSAAVNNENVSDNDNSVAAKKKR